MRKLILPAALCVAMLAACNNNKDSKETADSLNDAKDTSGMMAADSTASGEVMTAKTSDADFAVAAAAGGMTEVATGNVAKQKGVASSVKDYGAMMASDHTKAGAELMALAKSKNISLPAALPEENQKKLDDLSKLSGKDFDKAYVDMMVDDHEKTVSMFEDEEKNTSDPDFKAFATKTLPTLRAHLDAIKKIQAGMK